MERALKRLDEIRVILRQLKAYRRGRRQSYSDATIVLMYYWSVLNNQTRVWACRASHWPLKMPPGGLPSPSQFSRRLHSARVQRRLDELEAAVGRIDPPRADRLCLATVDGRPLVIGRHSHDRHAGYGRAAGGHAKGYKLHQINDGAGRRVGWRLTPMQTDEREIARRMIRDLGLKGYVLADRYYDSNWLFGTARERGLQLVVPRRYGAEKGMGRHRHDPARVRCRDLLENTVSAYGRELYEHRRAIERVFGTQACTPELLTHLPPWVRTRPRVYRWVQAKLVIEELHRLHREAGRIRVA